MAHCWENRILVSYLQRDPNNLQTSVLLQNVLVSFICESYATFLALYKTNYKFYIRKLQPFAFAGNDQSYGIQIKFYHKNCN